MKINLLNRQFPSDGRCGWKPHLPVSRLVGTVSNGAAAVRFKTAPTGPGENIELPNYFLKLHTDCDPNPQTNSLRYGV